MCGLGLVIIPFVPCSNLFFLTACGIKQLSVLKSIRENLYVRVDVCRRSPGGGEVRNTAGSG